MVQNNLIQPISYIYNVYGFKANLVKHKIRKKTLNEILSHYNNRQIHNTLITIFLGYIYPLSHNIILSINFNNNVNKIIIDKYKIISPSLILCSILKTLCNIISKE